MGYFPILSVCLYLYFFNSQVESGIINVENLQKSFSTIQANRNITIPSGEYWLVYPVVGQLQHEPDETKLPVVQTPVNPAPEFDSKEYAFLVPSQNSPLKHSLKEKRYKSRPRPAHLGQLPYHVAINYRENDEWMFLCNGALVLSPVTGKQIILTAGHCVTNDQGLALSSQFFSVYAGHGASDESSIETTETMGVSRVLVHGHFFKYYYQLHQFYQHDIAILLIDGAFKLTTYISPMDLPPLAEKYLGHLTISRWSEVMDGDDVDYELIKQGVDMITIKKCRNIYEDSGKMTIRSGHMCARSAENSYGENSSCQASSGSPAVAVFKDKRGNHKKYLLGIVSAGENCEASESPIVLIRISKYFRWLVKSLEYFEEDSQ